MNIMMLFEDIFTS